MHSVGRDLLFRVLSVRLYYLREGVRVKTRVKVMYGSSLSKGVVKRGSSRSCSSNSSHSSSLPSDNLAPYSAVYQVNNISRSILPVERGNQDTLAPHQRHPHYPQYHSKNPPHSTPLLVPQTHYSHPPQNHSPPLVLHINPNFNRENTFNRIGKSFKKLQQSLHKILQRPLILKPNW